MVKLTNLIFCFYFCIVLFFYVLISAPYLNGEYAELHASADSITYIEIAKYYRDFDDVELVTLTGNFIGPVLLLRLANYSNDLIVLLNLLTFVLLYLVICKNFDVNQDLLLILLCCNPMVFISLTSINKEIIGLCGFAFAACYFKTKRISYLLLCVIISVMARWHQLLTIVIFLFIKRLGKNNSFFGKHPGLILFSFLLILSLAYPYISSELFPFFSEGLIESFDGSSFGTTLLLDNIQNNYLAIISVIIKSFLNLFGNLITLPFSNINFDDIYNLYVVVGSQICFLVVLVRMVYLKRLSLDNEYVEFCCYYIAITSLTPFLQHRYLFPIYIILCLCVSVKVPATRKTEN